MSSRARFTVLIVSAPIILLVVVGGFLSKAVAREEGYQHLRVFEDVVTLILNNYVEPVKSDQIMGGAMQGLADGLDPDSAYLTPAQVATMDKPDGKAGVGIELTRQYYLRVISARDGSPAARAGLRTGDFIRAIDDKPTRDVSVMTGTRLLHGAPGSKVKLTIIRGNAAEPHVVELVREERGATALTARTVQPGITVVRVPAFTPETGRELGDQVKAAGADRVIIDLRGTAEGALDDGLAAARPFVKSGVLAIRESRDSKTPVAAQSGDGAIAKELTLLVDNGTTGAAELFAAALDANDRATLVGEHTGGRAGMQELVKLPNGSGLWLTTSHYLTAKGDGIHEKGLKPDVAVEAPDVEFGATAPATDPILEKAIEEITGAKKAA
jgi:carboxyl-terminal processing protease